MATLSTDSPVSRRIVSAFLDFLKSVEPGPDVDIEGLEVAKECLEEAFKLDSSSVNAQTQPGLLVDLFSSLDARQHELKSDWDAAITSVDGPSMTSAQNIANGNLSEALKLSVPSSLLVTRKECKHDPSASGVLNDELFGEFVGALERIHFFNTTPTGDDDHVQLGRAKHLFDEALTEMEKCGCQQTDCKSLAETLKSQGNQAMQSKLYTDAIELYTCAIALSENNATYYCNRAAAYTQIHEYTEAITDCNKSIVIDPNYSKAYSRLGMAYYAQGNYSDAINKGYLKALQLDPTNDSIQENIRVAEQKLKEEWPRTEQQQNGGPSHTQESDSQSAGSSRNWGVPPPFTSSQFSTAIPANFANVLRNMTANLYQGHNTQDRPQNGDEGRDVPPPFTSPQFNTAIPGDVADILRNVTTNMYQGHGTRDGPQNGDEGLNEPEIRIGGNISLEFGEDAPEDLTDAWRSVMGMFSSHHGPQGNMHRGSAPN